MENKDRRQNVEALEANIKAAQSGREGALEAILESSLGQDIIWDSLARVVEDAREDARYAAWNVLLKQHPDPVWLRRRFGDYPDPTIVADVESRVEQLEKLENEFK